MLNITETVSCLVIRTAQHIGNKLVHLSEKFRQNHLVTFYSTKNCNFLINTSSMKQPDLYYFI